MSLDNYDVGERLWRDDRYVVYRASLRGSDRQVLLKMPIDEAPPSHVLESLRRDYEVSRSLSSKGTLKALSLEFHGTSFVLVLEDFQGLPLSTLLHDSLSTIAYCRIAIATCEALETIHDAGLIHQDIKPANIIVDSRAWEVRLTGFAVEGTLAYMAPEQTGRIGRNIDRRSDLYSLGCTLYAMTTGSPPFPDQDHLGLVHSHIAVTPSPPPGTPKPLSDLILKLLAKDPEDRYQSARGVRQDLHLILNALNQGEELQSFRLGRQDGRDTLSLPSKIYGRDQEVRVLVDVLRSTFSGGRRAVLITGGAGIGKSSLVSEALRQSQGERYLFISGKWDQFGRNQPYSGLMRAFGEAIRKILTEPKENLEARKAYLLQTLGPNAGVLAEVVPQLDLLLGPQPPVTELGSVESERRFQLVVRQFVRALAQPEHPFIIFLDDLQWADSSSLHLARLLLHDPEIEHLLFIGAWRSQEVDATHPAAELAEGLAEDGETPIKLELGPLLQQDVIALLADTLSADAAQLRELAQLVHFRSQGNPFFLNQLLLKLVGQKLIRHEEGRWVWSLGRIREAGVTEDVVGLLISRIETLDPQAQRLLRLASCLGSKFEQRTLAMVAGMEHDNVAPSLSPLLREELVVRLGRAEEETLCYAFSHDKVQQAAYATIPENERPRLHASLGRLLLEDSKEEVRDARLFEITAHLNHARSEIISREQREELARLNLRAAVKARQSTAYEEARDYLEAGLALLPEDAGSFEVVYELAFRLNLERARTASLLNEYDEMENRASFLLKKAATDLDRIAVLEVQLYCYINQIQWEKVLDIGLRALEVLGERLPEHPHKGHVIANLGRLELRLRDYPPEALRGLPEMVDPRKRAALRVLRAISSAAYFTRPNLYPLVVFRMVSLSLSHGNCGDSAYGYVGYALAQSALLRRYQRGYDMGLVAIDIVKRFKARHLEGQIQLVFNIFIRHWKESLHATVEPLAEAAKASMSHGDAEYWSYSLFWNACHEFFTCRPLDEVRKKLDLSIHGTQRQSQEKGPLLFHLRHLVDELSGDHPTLPVKDVTEQELLARWEQARDFSNLCYCRGYQAIGCYLLGDPGGCLERIAFCRSHLDCLRGQSCLPVFLFYEALAHLSLAGRGHTARQALAGAKRVISMLKPWAKSCPPNYLHKLRLVQAEVARVRGKSYEAVMALFQEAIREARRQRFHQDEALAHELAGRYSGSFGFESASRAHFTEAISLYLQWGAKAVAHRLARDFPDLDPLLARTLEPATSDRVETLDLNTIITAAQALSQEIILEQLLETLTRLLLQNAGAERALLVLSGEDGPRLQAEASRDHTRVRQAKPIEKGARLSRAIVEFVLRTGEPVVLEDALHAGDFQQDPYILSHQVRSVLCAPLLRRGQIAGALYLENSQACRVFTPERLRTVQVLASQAAISLENAYHFQKQQSQHEEILREREARHTEEMRAKELTVRKDTLAGFLGIAAHDLRNALLAIQVWTGQLSGERVGNQVERAKTLIEEACAHAHGLVRSYLDASELEVSGRLVLRKAPFSLDGLVRETLAGQLRSLPEDRGQEVTVKDQLESIEYVGDRERLAQVLSNLLGNALLYCPGPVNLNLNLARTQDGARFDLRDDGPGITSSQANELFEPFRRASTGGDGRGLGLWICKVIVEAHGGRIGIESASPGGHFWFELPEEVVCSTSRPHSET